MYKRVLTMLLAVAATVSLMALPALAATSAESTALTKQITDTYKKIRRLNGNKSFHGYCGRMAGYTLFALGINKYCVTYNGNDMYDAYKKLSVTTGGYAVDTYHYTKYDLEEALLTATAGGTRDVYNLLVGFHRTNTDAGKKYGHAVVIYAIVDGMVYFTESFTFSNGVQEGKPIVISIKEFVDSYNEWTTFEGLVVFGTKEYTDFCDYYPTDLFATTSEEVPMYSIPSTVNEGEEEAKLLLNILPNERLAVTGVYENTHGEYFYEATYDGIKGFVDATKLSVLRINADQYTVGTFKVPTAIKKGKGFTVSGSVSLQDGTLGTVRVEIINASGKVLYFYNMNEGGFCASISTAAARALKFAKLATGAYTFNATCEIINYYVEDGKLLPSVKTVTLNSTPFTVGNATLPEQKPPVLAEREEIPDGWNFDVATGTWKYYKDGALTSGWVFTENADYYILEDGTAATGCVEIDGDYRYFTPTGAMRTGWYETAQGSLYLLSNGAPAIGWLKIDGQRCFFREDGIYDASAEYVLGEVPDEENIFVSMVELLLQILLGVQ